MTPDLIKIILFAVLLIVMALADHLDSKFYKNDTGRIKKS